MLLNRIIYICYVVAISGCSGPLYHGPFSTVPFLLLHGTERKILQEANEDFISVLKGETPTHAKLDESIARSFDGGTTYYKGDGYYLTANNSVSSFGGLEGRVVGPSLRFDPNFAPGNQFVLSNLKFVPYDEYLDYSVKIPGEVPGVLGSIP